MLFGDKILLFLVITEYGLVFMEKPKFWNVAYLEDVHNLYFSSNFDMFDTLSLNWLFIYFQLYSL
jgi:hypothetical protein